ncbi:MAG: hypothetical protein K2X99_10820 [Gemmatimonadaceae bacterium]|nr:hypothetical protein [Gemmatimonadaceae bacterium]
MRERRLLLWLLILLIGIALGCSDPPTTFNDSGGGVLDYRPPPVQEGAFVFDRSRNAMLLIGGRTDAGVALRVLYQFDGSAWFPLGTLGPAGSITPSVTYDSVRGAVVLHGGADLAGGPQGDTWEYRNSTWTRRAENAGPGIRVGAAMAWDPVRREVLLYGGSNDAAGETWAWNGATWTRRATTGPGPLAFAGMAFDAARNEMVLYGGSVPGAFGGPSSEHWLWNGSAWRRVSASAPPPRDRHVMVYDARRQLVVVFGGRGQFGAMGDTWEWDGTTWTRRDVSGPAPRWSAAAAYDPNARDIVLYGGTNGGPATADIWSFSGSAWVKRLLTP